MDNLESAAEKLGELTQKELNNAEVECHAEGEGIVCKVKISEDLE